MPAPKIHDVVAGGGSSESRRKNKASLGEGRGGVQPNTESCGSLMGEGWSPATLLWNQPKGGSFGVQ